MIVSMLETILWEHQKRGIADTMASIAQGHRKICLCSPTGGGKSLIACELIERWLAEGHSVSLYTNRRLLVDQTSAVLCRHGIEHGIRAAGYEDNRHLDVQISSIPTEHSRVFKSGRWDLHPAERVLVDEAHLQTGDMAQKILDAHLESGAAYVGLTATPLGLGHLYDTLIQAGTVSELRKCGALVACDHYGPDEPDARCLGKKTKTGEYMERNVVKAMMSPTIFARVYDWWLRLNPDARPAIGFAPGVDESVWFCEQFAKKGVRCAHIDGADVWLDGRRYRGSKEARREILQMSEEGAVKVIWNRFVLREGVDCPWLYHGIFATVFGSLQSYLQSGGRLLRAHPSIDRVILQDHGGNWWRHGSLNADREWKLEYTAPMVAGIHEDRLREKLEPEPIVCPQCGMVRSGGPECRCGYRAVRKSRPVVQKDGSLKEMVGDIFKPRRVMMRADTQHLWDHQYFRARNSRNEMTFRQAEALFFIENHYHPPRTLKRMPTVEADWYASVASVPKERLTQ